MLARQVGAAPRRWLSRLVIAMLAAAAAIAVWAAARTTPGASIVIEVPAPAVVSLPPVIAVIEQPPAPPPPLPPPSPPPPPPEPVAAVEPPVIGTRCPRDVSTIGVPLAQAPLPVGGSLRGAAAAPQGCTLAAWTEAEIHVSWDGGQTFARFEAKGVIQLVAAAAERVAIVRDDGALGVVRRGEAPVWRALPKRADDRQMQLYAAGAWIVVTLDRAGTALIAITDDDGATWRYLAPPDRASVVHLDPSGVLSAHAVTPTSEPDGEHIVEYVTQGLAASLRDPVWRRTRRTQGAVMLEVGPWSYTLESDQFWGCGGSSKLVAAHGGRRVTLLSDIRSDLWPFRVATNGTVTLAMFDQQLLRIAGARTGQPVALPMDVDVGELVSVDGAGTAIARTDQRVLRWSERGGWRMLLDAPAP